MTRAVQSAQRIEAMARPLRIGAWAVAIPLVALGALVPVWLADSPFLLLLASQGMIAALVALSLDQLTGNTGLLSFGHAGWYGFGTYAAGLTAIHSSADMLVVLPVTVIAAALLAAAVGSVLVRQIGKTFAILTLAFSQILYALVFVATGWTGGEDGLQGVPIATLAGTAIATPAAWYLVLYVTLIVFVSLLFALRRSPLGKAWLAIKDNAERARFIGIDVAGLKLLAYVISAALAALAGAMFVLANGATSPATLSWVESGKIMMYVVLGGTGTIIGPVIGAWVFTLTEHYISSFTDAWLIYFGAFFIIVVIVAPGGLFGAGRTACLRLSGRGRSGTP